MELKKSNFSDIQNLPVAITWEWPVAFSWDVTVRSVTFLRERNLGRTSGKNLGGRTSGKTSGKNLGDTHEPLRGSNERN